MLDVYREPGNFIDQAERSYSMNPATTGQLGSAFITHLQDTGVAATAKHFPGLGAATTDQDTDAGPVELDQPLKQIRQVDEQPYRAAIPAGVRLVMLSWAVYPALDPSMPAGFSPTVVGTELRKRLAFRGVTITDSIGAGAITRFGSYRTRGVLAARAGDDLILCSTTDPRGNRPGVGVAVLNGITRALTTGSLGRTRSSTGRGPGDRASRRPLGSGAGEPRARHRPGIIYTILFLVLFVCAPTADQERLSLDRVLVARYPRWGLIADFGRHTGTEIKTPVAVGAS